MPNLAAAPTPRTTRLLGVVALALALLAGLAATAPRAEAAGRQKAVAISPFAAATMVRFGVKPVAIGQTIGGLKRLPQALRNTRVLTLSHPNGPNLEVMAKMKPDVVFTSSRWSKGTPALKRLGIKVVDADPLNVNQVYGSVAKIGRVLKRSNRTNAVNRAIRGQIRKATNFSGSRPKVLVVLGVGTTAMAFLKNSWGGQIIKLAGGNLVDGGASKPGGFVRLSDEIVVAENPDRIVVVPHGSTDDMSQVVEFIKNNEAWQTTNAVKNGKVFVSVDNELLQSGPDVGAVIRSVRRDFITG